MLTTANATALRAMRRSISSLAFHNRNILLSQSNPRFQLVQLHSQADSKRKSYASSFLRTASHVEIFTVLTSILVFANSMSNMREMDAIRGELRSLKEALVQKDVEMWRMKEMLDDFNEK